LFHGTTEQLRQDAVRTARYESTEKKCPECGYVDEEGNWTNRTDGSRIVYHHVCPSCGADREHIYDLKKG